MPFQVKDQLPDNSNDEVGRLLRKAKAISASTKEKQDTLAQCFQLAQSRGYTKFTGDFRDYLIEHKGAHCLYMVPSGQRGALSKFIGQKVRLICMGKSDGRAGRYYLVGCV